MVTLNTAGYTPVPKGHVAFVVTSLEMTAKSEQVGVPASLPELALERWQPETDAYLELFREVGEDWLWFSRLAEPRERLAEILNEPRREIYRPLLDGRPAGLLELDFADPANVELSYFGLVPEAIGKGRGRWLMANAVELVWSRPETQRFWVHTCTGDSPQALGFYQAMGFQPYQRSIEVAPDPRLAGHLPLSSGGHVPVI